MTSSGRRRHLFVWLSITGALILARPRARAADAPPTVAVVLKSAERADKKLDKTARDLSSLVEVFLSTEEGIRLVDRATLDKAIKELALVPGEEAGRLGRLTRAGTLLVGSVRAEGDGYLLDAHLVEGLSGKIVRYLKQRFAEKDIPRVATELARIVQRAALGIGPPRVTVAVGNFDYEGIFDRLAPLQLRLKTLLVDELLRHPEIRVLERESMRALVDEIELATRGAADPEGLPAALPPREATYLVTGSYEEVGGKKEPWVRVRVSLTRAAAATRIMTVEESVRVSGLPALSYGVASRIVKALLGKELPPERPGAREAAFTRHFHRALNLSCGVGDVDFYDSGLQIPMPIVSRRMRCFIAHWDEPSYGAFLGRIVNELECALYLKPGDIRVKTLLAFACANRKHCHPERALELLEEIERADPEGRFGRAARRIHAYNTLMGRPTDPPPNFLEASAACVDVWERLFRDTPGELRGQDELSRFVEAGDWAASRLKDYDRAYKITRDYLQHVADLPKLEMAEEVINMRIAMRSFADSARELGRSEEARRFALALAAKTTGHRAVKFYLGIARAALADGACEEALTASRRVVELCEGEGHPWYVSRSMSAKTIAGRALCLSGRNDEGVKTVVSFLNQYARYSRTTSGLLTDDAKEITKFLGDRYEKRGEWRSALRFYEKLYESAYHRDDDWLAARVKRARERTGKASARASKRIDVKVFCPPRPLVRPGRSPRYRGRAKRIDKIVADGPVLWCVGDLRQDIGGRLLSFDTRTEHWTDVDPEVRATCVLPTRERLYVGTRGLGLWSRPMSGGAWEKLTEENGLPFDYVTALASDGERIFVGMARGFRGGVGELDPGGGVRMLPGAIGTIGGVNGMAAAGGYIWVAEPRKGTWRHDLRSGACELVHSHGSCPEAQLRADADGAWITSRGWNVYRTDRLGRMHAVFPGGFWLGRETPYHLDFRCGARAGGKVWLAGKSIGHLESCGIYSYDPETREFDVYGPQDGIEATYAYCIAKTPGFLWFGTTDGLVRIRLPEQRAGRKGEGE